MTILVHTAPALVGALGMKQTGILPSACSFGLLLRFFSLF